jgi:urease accessory protein
MEAFMRVERAVATTIALLLAATAPVAYAHPFGDHGADFAAGLAHPFVGLDHLLAMLAVGIWATQLARPRHVAALWAVPLAFVVVMALAALGAVAGLTLPAVEGGVAASVLILGLLVAARVRLPLSVSALLVAGFAVFHGYAHGVEMPPAASMLAYGAGFVLATAVLHAVGIVGAQLFASRAMWVRWAGAGVAAAGVMLFAGL